MPTPFYHLSLASKLLKHRELQDTIRQLLETYQCEFMFGNTAPDVQVVSGQSREATHFFNLPIRASDQPAWERMLAEHPRLAQAEALDSAHAAFIAGYLCHLQADWIWITDIFAPVFGPDCEWGTFHGRLYYHNVLRAYLDVRMVQNLSTDTEPCLRLVNPDGWLPFVSDHHLVEWRNFLTPQLGLGGTIQTVEVFSSRQGISAPEFYALLGSEECMQQEIFSHIPLDAVKRYNQRVLDENARLLNKTLAFTLHPTPMTIAGRVFRGVQL